MCKRCIVQIKLFKIVLRWIGVDFAETRVKYDILFVTEKTIVYLKIKTDTTKNVYREKCFNLKDFILYISTYICKMYTLVDIRCNCRKSRFISRTKTTFDYLF